MNFPSISIIVPTFNSGRVLRLCLESIVAQGYPKELVEVVIADAGSTDDTLEIARKYPVKIVQNSLKTGEAGKAAGYHAAKNEIIAFVDSDNVLPETNWLARMIQPYADPEINGTEPIVYSYREGDGAITRYCALMGMNDPLCFFLGNYDRLNLITGKWTEIELKEEDKGDYVKIEFLSDRSFPTIGANGFTVRKSALDLCGIGDYLFDIDVVYELYTRGMRKFAKVKIGIVHLFSGNMETFVRKTKRRVKDYLYYSKLGVRKYPWKSLKVSGLVKFILYTCLVFPLFFQALIGYTRKRDTAWFYHIPFCIITLWIYGAAKVKGLLKVEEMDRKNWSQ